MKNASILTRNQMKAILGGTIPPHGEPCESHSDCTAHAPICVASGTTLGSVCCDSEALKPGGFCDFNGIG